MQRTPHLTYLAERMQSARGLGWDFNPTAIKTSHTTPRRYLRALLRLTLLRLTLLRLTSLRFTFVRSILLRLTSPTPP